jgi:TolA-binding protein
MIWLLYAKNAILRIFKVAIDHPWQAALIAVLCLSLWLYSGKQDALATITKRDATIVAMKKASSDARAAQIALNKQVTDKQTEIARLTDANETNRRDISMRSRAYADRMRADTYCRQASATAESGIAQSDNGAGADAVMVTREDFDILTGNTARLMDVYSWSQEMISAGLAVPVE